MINRILSNRSYQLAALALILTLLSFRFAFWKTWEAIQLNKQFNSQMEQAADVSYNPAFLERKNRNLQQAIGLYRVDSLAYRNNLLTAISALAEKEKVNVVEVPGDEKKAYYQTANYKIQKIGLQGPFSNLTRFCYLLEQEKHIGLVRSVQYVMLNAQGTTGAEKKLFLYVYLIEAR